MFSLLAFFTVGEGITNKERGNFKTNHVVFVWKLKVSMNSWGKSIIFYKLKCCFIYSLFVNISEDAFILPNFKLIYFSIEKKTSKVVKRDSKRIWEIKYCRYWIKNDKIKCGLDTKLVNVIQGKGNCNLRDLRI